MSKRVQWLEFVASGMVFIPGLLLASYESEPQLWMVNVAGVLIAALGVLLINLVDKGVRRPWGAE